jgi:hypothetical protein
VGLGCLMKCLIADNVISQSNNRHLSSNISCHLGSPVHAVPLCILHATLLKSGRNFRGVGLGLLNLNLPCSSSFKTPQFQQRNNLSWVLIKSFLYDTRKCDYSLTSQLDRDLGSESSPSLLTRSLSSRASSVLMAHALA